MGSQACYANDEECVVIMREIVAGGQPFIRKKTLHHVQSSSNSHQRYTGFEDLMTEILAN